MAMVANGTIDLECGSTTNTPRQEQVDFSQMIFVDGGSLLVSIASNIKSLSDIAGKRVAVDPWAPPRRTCWLKRLRRNIEVDLVRVREHLRRHRRAGKRQRRTPPRPGDLIGLALASKNPTELALAEQYLSYEPYGLMLRRGDADFRPQSIACCRGCIDPGKSIRSTNAGSVLLTAPVLSQNDVSPKRPTGVAAVDGKRLVQRRTLH